MSRPDAPRGEEALIDRLAAALDLRRRVGGAVGFGDDMAPVHPDLPAWLWTCDQLADGVDFVSERHAWVDIGYKAMAVNLSDCAAMGVEPVSALCALTLDQTLPPEAALELARGLDACARAFGCTLCGGDTNGWSNPTVITVAVIGRCPDGLHPVPRSGARAGDGLWLTGPVGGSLLGRHLHPVPRVRESLQIVRRLAPHAMIDISDGLALDLYRMLEASRCGAVLETAALERIVHDDARQRARQTGRPALEHALYDGEDFELIVALPASAESDARALGLHRIGRVESGDPVVWLEAPTGSRQRVERRGWEHLRGPQD